jgi:hypothetical protein
VKGRIPAALAGAALLVGATTAWAQLAPEGAPYATGAAPYTVYTADFNGDGLPDMATGNGDGSTFSVFLRQPGGGFAEEAGSPFAAATSNGAVGDVNGDGRPDFVNAGFLGEGLGVLLRNAGGGFTRETTPPIGGRLSAVGIGDFNGDGKGDLAVANYDASQVTILVRNLTNDGFTTTQNLAAGTNPRQIAVADFDGDGALDLAVANVSSNNVMVYRGAGNGTFSQEGVPLAVGSAPNGITVGDYDGNGRPDLAVTNNASNTVTILLRTAANTGFAEGYGSPIAVATAPSQIATADFDRNGRPDLAIAASSGVMDELLNTGATFARDTPSAVTGAPVGVAVADFNRDGVPDAAVSSLNANSVTALLSPSPPAQPTPVATPVATPTPAAPVRNKSVAAEVESGKVLIKLKGKSKFVPLTPGVIANGAEIDARKGRVGITTSTKEEADFYDGIFKISQSGGITTVALSEKLTGCPKAKKSTASAAAKKPKTRKLWGDGKGKFRTKGSYSAATVRGTRWLVTDTCTSTTTKVAQGTVSVRDDVKKKTFVVRKGKSYTARKKR